MEWAQRRQATKEVFGSDYFKVDPARCALLVIDMQNSFVHEDGIFCSPLGKDITPRINEVVERARSTSIPVIWTQSDHSFPGGGLILERYPVIKETKELWIGDHSFDLYDKVTPPVEGEHRIVKHKYDAFHDTDLDTVLKNLGKDTVVITGVATEVCCESTARAAFFHEYRVVILRDATAAFVTENHESTIQRIDTLFGRAMDADEIFKIWEQGGE